MSWQRPRARMVRRACATMAVGVLRIAGVERDAVLPLETERRGAGLMVKGTLALLMTDNHQAALELFQVHAFGGHHIARPPTGTELAGRRNFSAALNRGRQPRGPALRQKPGCDGSGIVGDGGYGEPETEHLQAASDRIVVGHRRPKCSDAEQRRES